MPVCLCVSVLYLHSKIKRIHNYTGGGLVTKLCPTLLWPCGLKPARLLCPWDFLGKNAGVGCHFLLQGIFWHRDRAYTSHVSHCRRILHHWATRGNMQTCGTLSGSSSEESRPEVPCSEVLIVHSGRAGCTLKIVCPGHLALPLKLTNPRSLGSLSGSGCLAGLCMF